VKMLPKGLMVSQALEVRLLARMQAPGLRMAQRVSQALEAQLKVQQERSW
jgi:hypothetical protein